MNEQKVEVDETDFLITRLFDASPDEVWTTWTDPASFERWINAEPGSVLSDVRPGGRWAATLRGPAGMRMAGEYREVVPREKLVWTMDGPGEPVVMHASFSASADGKTVAVYGQNVPAPFPCDQAVAGATAILDAFERELKH
jgi:uncharacterized protein YndB with AHSA1/START domain